MSMKWMRCPNHILQHVPSEKLTQNPTPSYPSLSPFPLFLEQWYGMVLWQYDCQPWLKAFKDFLQVPSESGPSMKWMGGPNHILQHVLSRGSTPRVPAKRIFFCGTSSEKASREGPNIHRTTARPRFENRRWTLTPLSCGPRQALELHSLERGNRYMSRRYGMMQTHARAVSLADFWFALIPVRNSHGALPTEDKFSPPRVVRTAITPPSRIPHVPTWHQSFPQHPTIEWYKWSAHLLKIGGRIIQQSPCIMVRPFALILSIESHSSNKILRNNTQQSAYIIISAGRC